MPRCYMVKKGTSRLEGPPPCSPTEASVAPPCYHPSDNEPRPAQYAESRHISAHYDEPRSGDYAENTLEGVYSETPHRDYSSRLKQEYDEHGYRPPSPDYEREYKIPRTVQYIENVTVEFDENAEFGEPRPADYAEPHNADYNGEERPSEPVPSESEAGAEYAELTTISNPSVRQHSAADTEAAHDLLSLAASVPRVTLLAPLYTYTVQPASIYIIDDLPPDTNLYHAVQTDQVEYAAVEPHMNTYIAYQETVTPQISSEYQPVYREATPSPQPLVVDEPVGVPVSVIEAAPPLSVQVPVIEAVPLAHQSLPPPAEQPSDADLDEPAQLICLNEKQGKYACADCGKCYATSSNLSRHKQTHRSLDSQAAKRCDECGKAYVSMPALAMHVLTHRMGHVCGVCGKQFSRPWLLRGHLRSHTGEKPYNCGSCGKAFADRSNLRAHLQTHSGDKKWECVRCNKTFALKSYLNKHQEAACTQDD